jgi:hypothetical protein
VIEKFVSLHRFTRVQFNMVVGDWLIAIEDCKSAIQHFELAMEEAKSLWKQLVKLRLFQSFWKVSKAYVGLPLSMETLILRRGV